MTLHVPLSSEVEARLREFAAAAGQDVPKLVAEAIEEKLAAMEEDAAESTRPRTGDQWLVEFDRWVASHTSVRHSVDDSRESIYEGRGE